MLIVENPLLALVITLAVLAFFLLLFKITNYFEDKKAKEKNKTKKSSEEPKKEELKKDSEDKKTINEKSEEKEDFNQKDYTNYLYDRFVVSPSNDDNIVDERDFESFLSEENYDEIKNKKVKIDVKAINEYDNKDNLYRKISDITNNNREEKERLLNEFNNLSKEMKLLLIENILNK